MVSLRFSGTLHLDRTATRAAIESCEQARFAPFGADALPPASAIDAQTERYLKTVEGNLDAATRRAIETELDEAVTLRWQASHIHQPDWGRDFIGDDVFISRTDEPAREPVKVPRHMGQSFADFWPTLLEAAKAFNRPV